MSDNLKTWKLADVEVGYIVGASGPKLKVYMGKVLPFVTKGKPKIKTIPIDKGFLLNDQKCKPSVSTRAKSVNYLTIPTDGRIQSKYVKNGEKVRIKVLNHSVDQMYVSDRLN